MTAPSSGASRTPATGRITRINPEGLHETAGYHHVTLTEAGRTAHLAGQCPLDASGRVVAPGDHAAQARQVAENALRALAAVGARPQDVVRSVVYVVSDRTPVLGEVWAALRACPLGPAFTTASTLLGVTALGFTGQLVEVDLTAALPDPALPGPGGSGPGGSGPGGSDPGGSDPAGPRPGRTDAADGQDGQ